MDNTKNAIWAYQGKPQPGTEEHAAFRTQMYDWVACGKPSIGSPNYDAIFGKSRLVTIEVVTEEVVRSTLTMKVLASTRIEDLKGVVKEKLGSKKVNIISVK